MFTIGLIIGFIAGWFVNDKFDLIVDKIKSFRNKQFIMFGGLRIYIIGLIILAVIGAGGYVLKLQKDNAILQANAIKLESAIAEQKTLIENQKKDFEEILNANKRINALMDTLKKEMDDLDKRFNKKNRDLGKDAIAKTSAVEKIINGASKDATRCVEIASGSPLTEQEKNAKKKSEINSQCPSLANPSYVPY